MKSRLKKEQPGNRNERLSEEGTVSPKELKRGQAKEDSNYRNER
jgi:hypothetical protein